MRALTVFVAGALACGAAACGSESSTPDGGGGSFTMRLAAPAASTSGLAWNGKRFAAVGRDGIYGSSDGLAWSAIDPFLSLRDVASNGTGFVAVGDNQWIEASPAGANWRTAMVSIGGARFNAVASSGSTWVVVGDQGTIYSSPDGTSWTARGSAGLTTQNLRAVTWTGSQFVAVGAAGTVITSPDGAGWTLRTAPSSDELDAVAASSSLVVVASGTQLFSAPDAATWTPRATLGRLVNRLMFVDGQFVAVSDYGAATSPDAITWTENTGVLGILDSAVHASGQYWALGPNLTTDGTVFSSANGRDWTTRVVAHNLTSLARGPDGRLVAVGGSHASQTSLDGGIHWEFGVSSTAPGQNYPLLNVVYAPSAGGFLALVQIAANQDGYRSTDGTTWTDLGYAPCYGNFAASGAVIVNLGMAFGPCVATSTDGKAWTQQTAPAALRLHQAFWTGAQFVAVGESGALATSGDGTSWAARTTGVTANLSGAAGSPTTLVVVGDEGTILSSSDAGASWDHQPSGTTATLMRVTWTGHEFYAVGGGGTLLRSTNGITWARITTPFDQRLGDALWLEDLSRLVLVGDGGLTATSP